MKYYVISDVHGFYTEMIEALKEKGFFDDTEPHKLIICGDLLDRGPENQKVVEFVLDLMKKDMVILIKGNHEDLLEKLVEELLCGDTYWLEMEDSYHIRNGTWQTALELTGYTHGLAISRPKIVANFIKNTVFYKQIMPQMLNYFETDNYIFTHGYIPCHSTVGTPKYTPHKRFYFNKDWRNESNEGWEHARWYNGMDFVCKQNLRVLDKTVVCGHWNASYGHAQIEHKGSEFGPDSDFSPFYHDGIIAIDACTKFSGRVNCIIIED